MLGGGNRKRPLAEFQTGPGNDVVAIWRVAKSWSWWDISDCRQHAYRLQSKNLDGLSLFRHFPSYSISFQTPTLFIIVLLSFLPVLPRPLSPVAFYKNTRLVLEKTLWKLWAAKQYHSRSSDQNFKGSGPPKPPIWIILWYRSVLAYHRHARYILDFWLILVLLTAIHTNEQRPDLTFPW